MKNQIVDYIASLDHKPISVQYDLLNKQIANLKTVYRDPGLKSAYRPLILEAIELTVQSRNLVRDKIILLKNMFSSN